MTKNKRLKPEYAEALLLYATTTEQLKSIADRLGLRYINLSNYMRRNCPVALEQHKALLLSKGRALNNGAKSRSSKASKYSEAVALLAEMKKKQYNVIRKVAEETGVNYHSLRMHIYTYHRELIGLDPAKNRSDCSPRYVARYGKAVALLASEPKQPENLILHVAEQLGLGYHALRSYIYIHHPELAQRNRKR